MRSRRPAAERNEPALLALVEAVHGTTKVDHMPSAYLKHVPQVIPAVAHGFYLLAPATGKPYRVATVGTTDRFLYRYELVRDIDPLIPYVRDTGRPVDTQTLLPAERWRRHPMSEVFTEAGYARYLLGPLRVGGQLVGTLNLARSPQEPPFTDAERATLQRVCRTVGLALERALEFSRLQERNHALEAALAGLRAAVVVMDCAGRVQYVSEPARALLDSLAARDRATLLEMLHAAARSLSPESARTRLVRVSLRPGDALRREEEALVRLVWAGGRDGSVVAFIHVADVEQGGGEKLAAALGSWSGALTPQERRVVLCLAEGLSNAQIAARLGISENTVKRHLKNLYAKLGVNTRAGLVARIMSG